MMGRQIVIGYAVKVITDTDFQLVKPVKHIKLGERNPGNTRHGKRLTHQHRIKPAAATLTPGDSAKLMATLTQTLPGFIAKFSRERTRADAGCIGFDDAQNIAGCRWPDAGTARRCARNGVGAGDERIGSVIDIKQHALRALEQYAVAAFARFVEALPHRLGI